MLVTNRKDLQGRQSLAHKGSNLAFLWFIKLILRHVLGTKVCSLRELDLST